METKLLIKNPREFLRRWKEGIKNLSMAQQLHAKMIGHIGAIVGLSLALTVLIIKGVWYFCVFLFFIAFLQGVELIGTRQRRLAAIQIEKITVIQKQAVKKLMAEQNKGVD